MWEESWAQPLIQWLLTPALITGALVGAARLFDPPTRWSRRLKSDIAILSGLPEGPEKRVWQASVVWQAMQLREYRRAFVGGVLVTKWVGLAIFGALLFGIVSYPPINKPGDKYPFGLFDYCMMAAGFLSMVIYIVSVASGHDFFGRSARELLLRRRLRRFRRRFKKLLRLDKERARRIIDGSSIRPRGSKLGFSTQVDEFGPWMRDGDLRSVIRLAGWGGADHAAVYYKKLRERGVEMPPWPDPETRRPPEPQQEPEPEPERKRRNFLGCWKRRGTKG